MKISIAQTAQKLLQAQDILLIAHKSPDGDTLGSCFALYYALSSLGKRVRVECNNDFPQKYQYFLEGYTAPCFEPQFIVAVDVADEKLFGDALECYKNRVDLCIDHHRTNTHYARMYCIDETQAATAQLVYLILLKMRIPCTPLIADCLFTGITTDTGCFRYTNVTAQTHLTAARLIENGARAGMINRIMFEQKSKSRIAVERSVLETLSYDFDGRCAMVCISQNLLRQTGACEEELEGVSAIPRQIDGVWVGVTFNEREGGYKISLRTDSHIDAAAVCRVLGGGGHKAAAGCFITGDFQEAKQKMHAALEPFMQK